MATEGTEQTTVTPEAATQVDAGDASTPETTSTQTPDDQMRAIYDTLAGQDGAEPSEPTPEPPTDDAEEEGAPAGETAETKPKDGGQAIEPERLDKARRALSRWKYPDDVIAGLPESRILELGEQAMSVQAEQDRIGNQRRDLAKMLEELEAERAKSKPEQPEGEAEAGAVTTPSSMAEFLDAIRNDELYSDLADPLTKAFDAMQRQYDARLAETQQALQAKIQQIDHLYTELDRVEMGLARNELSADIPQLKDAAKYKAVQKRALELSQLPGYADENGNPDVLRLMRDAAQLEFGSELKNQLQAELTNRYRKQTNGQPSSASSNAQPAAGLDPDAKMKLALQKLSQGKKAEDVREELSSLATA